MKWKTAIALTLVCWNSWAAKKISIESIGMGDRLFINGTIQLPKTYALNKGAPSKIDVLERQGKEWVLTEKINLNDFFALTELIRFQRPVHLKSQNSEIKLAMSLYHCPADHRGLCVIDDFEGLIKRSSRKQMTEVTLNLVGTDPAQY